ncbi:MAG TPA: dihydroneopterin aldolase [Firmicutes bacterium]|nr:dihydroneopterin aldolase [Bacillota bacterium]
MDKIIVKGLHFYAYHGVNPEEKEKGQPFIVDITAYADLTKPSKTDDLKDTVNYSKMSKTVRRVVEEAKYNLIEKLAGRICEEILAEYNGIDEVEVTVKKPRAPMSGDFDYVAVSLIRRR